MQDFLFVKATSKLLFFSEPAYPAGKFTARLFFRFFYITEVGVVLHQGGEAVQVHRLRQEFGVGFARCKARIRRPSVKFRGWAHPEGVVCYT